MTGGADGRVGGRKRALQARGDRRELALAPAGATRQARGGPNPWMPNRSSRFLAASPGKRDSGNQKSASGKSMVAGMTPTTVVGSSLMRITRPTIDGRRRSGSSRSVRRA